MLASSVIDASLTTQNITFRPGGPSVSFGVSVINRSDRFASFQLEFKRQVLAIRVTGIASRQMSLQPNHLAIALISS
ncbi:MAG: hypothetical protein HC930_11395 [Hydrococcus sp. SU_1_0]|nr:hypothetical protein [Hydrococcus sp. SU_1_0]